MEEITNETIFKNQCLKAVVLKPWPAGHMCPARPSGVAREAIFIGKKT